MLLFTVCRSHASVQALIYPSSILHSKGTFPYPVLRPFVRCPTFNVGSANVALLRRSIAQLAYEQELEVHEVPKCFVLEAKAWTVRGGLLNSQLKLARKALQSKYGKFLR